MCDGAVAWRFTLLRLTPSGETKRVNTQVTDSGRGTRRIVNGLGAAGCVGLLLYAILYLQEVLWLEPCPLCIFQRIAFMVLGGIFLLAALHAPRGGGRNVYAVLIGLAALIGAGIAGRHVWLQFNPPEGMASCGAGLNYMLETMALPDVVLKVFQGNGDCGAIDWTFLGLGIPAWSLVCFVLLGIVGVAVNWRRAGH